MPGKEASSLFQPRKSLIEIEFFNQQSFTMASRLFDMNGGTLCRHIKVQLIFVILTSRMMMVVPGAAYSKSISKYAFYPLFGVITPGQWKHVQVQAVMSEVNRVNSLSKN